MLGAGFKNLALRTGGLVGSRQCAVSSGRWERALAGLEKKSTGCVVPGSGLKLDREKYANG